MDLVFQEDLVSQAAQVVQGDQVVQVGLVDLEVSVVLRVH